MSAKTVLIVGAGGVLGLAVAREFSRAGYIVIGVRREHAEPSGNDSNVFNRIHYCDFKNREAIQRLVDQVADEHGKIDVMVCNAAHLVAAPFLELTDDDFKQAWDASVGSAVTCVQAVLPSMLSRHQGSIIFSGATAATRGTARFAAFASAKFALRGLTQSLAREYQAQGIHIAHVIIDGLLRGSASIAKFSGTVENSIDPAVVAGTYRWLAEQPSSAWTLEMDIRPSNERF